MYHVVSEMLVDGAWDGVVVHAPHETEEEARDHVIELARAEKDSYLYWYKEHLHAGAYRFRVQYTHVGPDVPSLSTKELMACSILIENNKFNTFVVDSWKNQSLDEASQDDLPDDELYGCGIDKGYIDDDVPDLDEIEFEEYVKDGPVYSPIIQRALKRGSLRRAQQAVDRANGGLTMEEHNQQKAQARKQVQRMRLAQTLKYALKVARSPMTVDYAAQVAREHGINIKDDVRAADRRVVQRIRKGIVLFHPDGTMARVSDPGQYRAKVARFGFSEINSA